MKNTLEIIAFTVISLVGFAVIIYGTPWLIAGVEHSQRQAEAYYGTP